MLRGAGPLPGVAQGPKPRQPAEGLCSGQVSLRRCLQARYGSVLHKCVRTIPDRKCSIKTLSACPVPAFAEATWVRFTAQLVCVASIAGDAALVEAYSGNVSSPSKKRVVPRIYDLLELVLSGIGL